MTPIEIYSSGLNLEINKEINKIFKEDLWDEDNISSNVIISIRNYFRKNPSINSYPEKIHIECQLFKLKGNNENRFGDIAFLVKIDLFQNSFIEGVAFLEAKKRYLDSDLFKAVKSDQLSRIVNNAPRSKLLLYNFDSINFQQNVFNQDLIFDDVNAVTIPINFAANFKTISMGLFQTGVPLHKQILNRYILGQDLEFDNNTISNSKGFGDLNKLPFMIVSLKVSTKKNTGIKALPVNPEYFTEVDDTDLNSNTGLNFNSPTPTPGPYVRS